ncbi:MAG: HD domain-containing protein [Oscillospiraceae bacterium]|nr:HD domain-containing protein [Oscillospiraceae bacterium]
MIILPEQVTKAIDVLERAGYDAYVVGDCVRELLLGNNPQDYDIVTNAGINDILFAFREYRISDEGMKRGEVLVTVVGMIIQVSPYRREVVGNRVVYAEDLETDLFRRGFTMNAMAYSPRSGLIDPFGGRASLRPDPSAVAEEEREELREGLAPDSPDDINRRTGVVRLPARVIAVGEMQTRTVKENGKSSTESWYDMSRCFTSDPSRILEAMRYCSEGEYVIEEKTADAIRANVSCFEYAEKDKLFSELSRIVMGKYAARVLEQYADILKHLLPEIDPCIGFEQHSVHHDFMVWTHICKSVGFAVPELSVRFAMLFHDLGKPDCFSVDTQGHGHFKGHGERSRLLAERIMRRLEFPAALFEEISWLVFYHDREIPEDRPGLKRLLDALGAEDLRKLIQCETADARAKKVDNETADVQRLRAASTALRVILDSGECYNIRQLAITPRELMERRLVSSEQEAEQLMNALFEIVLDKPAFNNKLMLIDMAEKSKQRLDEMIAERERAAAERRAAKALNHRRGEPVFSRKKKQ